MYLKYMMSTTAQNGLISFGYRYLYVYIYTCVYICVCVCVIPKKETSEPGQQIKKLAQNLKNVGSSAILFYCMRICAVTVRQ